MNLQNFDKMISSTIVKRGKSYFKSDQVMALTQLTNTEWQAEVAGSYVYNVEVQLSDTNQIISSHCDCPYDGPYCKHEVAVFYALQKESKREIPSSPLEMVLNKQSKEDLVAFLLELAQKSAKLQQQLMQRFLVLPQKNDPYAQAQKIIARSLQMAHHKGYISWEDVPDAVHGIEQVLGTANGCIAQKQYGTAYELAILCYKKTADLLEMSEEYNTIDELLAESLVCLKFAIEDGLETWTLDEQERYFEQLLQLIKLPIFEDETHSRFTLLEQALPFCQDPSFAQRLQDYLATLTVSSYYQNRIEELQLQVLMQWAEEEDMFTYLQAHPDNPDMRETVILHYIEQQNPQQVLALCAEGIDHDFNDRNLRQKWENYAYYAHETLGNTQAMRAIAFPLAVEGSLEFYVALRTLYSNEEWPEILQDLLLSFDEMPHYPHWYATEMIEEQQWVALLHYCKKNPHLVESYAHYLIQDYREDVKALFMQKLMQEASTASNRSHYKALRDILQHFNNFGFTGEVAAIITHLKELHPKRPALHEELAKIK